MHRRNFVLGFCVVAASAVAMHSGALFGVVAAPVTADGRSYTAGKFGLDLNGVFAGWAQSATGGDATTDVVTEKVGVDNVAKKNLGNVKYDDITIKCSTSMSKAFYQVIQTSFHGDYTRVNGAVIATDFNLKEVGRMNFLNALLTEVTFPALDAASKDGAALTIKLTPETTRYVSAGTNGPTVGGSVNEAQKKWLVSSFRLNIDGVDVTKVDKIDALTVKQAVIAEALGTTRDPVKMPARITWPNLVVTLPLANAQSMQKWADDFVVKGRTGASKNGTLEFLDDARNKVLFRISFKNLGLFKLTQLTTSSDNVKRVKAEMYMEGMDFEVGTGAMGG
jgi:phage tail-like protein